MTPSVETLKRFVTACADAHNGRPGLCTVEVEDSEHELYGTLPVLQKLNEWQQKLSEGGTGRIFHNAMYVRPNVAERPIELYGLSYYFLVNGRGQIIFVWVMSKVSPDKLFDAFGQLNEEIRATRSGSIESWFHRGMDAAVSGEKFDVQATFPVDMPAMVVAPVPLWTKREELFALLTTIDA